MLSLTTLRPCMKVVWAITDDSVVNTPFSGELQRERRNEDSVGNFRGERLGVDFTIQCLEGRSTNVCGRYGEIIKRGPLLEVNARSRTGYDVQP